MKRKPVLFLFVLLILFSQMGLHSAFADEVSAPAATLKTRIFLWGQPIYLGVFDHDKKPDFVEYWDHYTDPSQFENGPILWNLGFTNDKWTERDDPVPMLTNRVLVNTIVHHSGKISAGLENLTLETTDLYLRILPFIKENNFSIPEQQALGSFQVPEGRLNTNEANRSYVYYRDLEPCPNMTDFWCVWEMGTNGDPTMDSAGCSLDTAHGYGVRPQTNLDLHRVLAATDAEETVGTADGNPQKVVKSVPAAWKLTLLDESRAAFQASLDKDVYPEKDSLRVTYSGAETGANEYIRYFLCDAEDNVLYTGYVPASSASGELEIRLPDHLTEGVYSLKVLSQQINGPHLSDYAGGIVDLPLRIDNGTTVPDLNLHSGFYQKNSKIWLGEFALENGPVWEKDGVIRDWFWTYEKHDNGPISWIVNERDGNTLDLYSEYVLFDTVIHSSIVPGDHGCHYDGTSGAPVLPYTETSTYKYALLPVRDRCFSDRERVLVGEMHYPENVGPSPDGYWYVIPGELSNCEWKYYGAQTPATPHKCSWEVDPEGFERAGRNGPNVTYLGCGVRPAMPLSLDTGTLVFSSLAEGGKTGTGQALQPIGNVETPGEWKLTLLDETRNGFKVSVEKPESVLPGSTLQVRFEGAGTENEDFVSVILTDLNDNTLYYGSLEQGTAAGVAGLVVPQALPDGDYVLKFFSEQKNGDFHTDYAGPFVDVPLHVDTGVLIRFHANDGSEPEMTLEQKTVAGVETRLLKNEMTRPGYRFAGWNTNRDGSGTFIEDEGLLTPDSDMDLFAVWEALPPDEEPRVWYRIRGDRRELPRTGLKGVAVWDDPASLRYQPLGLSLQIPSLNVHADIVLVEEAEGEYPVSQLGGSAGLLSGSDLPGQGHAVIAAHNTLNETEYGPFALLGTLEPGDLFFVRDARNELLTFSIYDSRKIPADDWNALAESMEQYENTLTLLTCEDELPEGGYASRRIVSARIAGGN